MFAGRLRACLALDENISAVDLSPNYSLVATACGTACYIWSTSDFSLKFQLNRTGRAIHKKDIRVVKFSPCGGYVATCADDLKVVVWSLLQGGTVHTILVGHKDLIFDALFLNQSASLVAAAAKAALGGVGSGEAGAGTSAGLPLSAASYISTALDQNLRLECKYPFFSTG